MKRSLLAFALGFALATFTCVPQANHEPQAPSDAYCLPPQPATDDEDSRLSQVVCYGGNPYCVCVYSDGKSESCLYDGSLSEYGPLP